MSHDATKFDADDAEALFRAYCLGDFLSDCIVENDYRPPVTLTSTLYLTARGSRLAGQIKGNGVELREAQLAAFLHPWAGDEILIDVGAMDLESLRLNISSEIRRKKIRYPWIYGRQMYDLIADSAFHGASRPTYDEAMRLLDALPQGVFQSGPYISGPYGLIEGREWRLIGPARTVPGYHCNEIDCTLIHLIALETGHIKVAAASKSLREKVSKLHAVNTEAVAATEEVVSNRIRPFNWRRGNYTLPHFLGDCLTLANLRALVVNLLNSKGGKLREECTAKLGVEIKSAPDFVSGIDLAELMQIILLATDDEVHQALNLLIWAEEIRIPTGEIRRSKIAPQGVGYLGMRLEASSLGVRHAPSSSYLFVRLQAIIRKAFPEDDKIAQQRLSWLLRSYDGETPDAKLHLALADGDPKALIERLLVADRAACATAFSELGLPMDCFQSASDAEITQVLTWHLGFNPYDDAEGAASVNEAASKLRKIVQSLPASHLDRADEERIRSVAGNLFPALEKLLKRTLSFTAWVLLNDHYKTTYEMQYSVGAAEHFLDQWLSEKPGLPKLSSEATLAEILSCIGALSKDLSQIYARREDHRRPFREYPRIVRDKSSSFRFPFVHTKPFLDLAGSSRQGIESVLRNVVSKLMAVKAPEVRNGLLHDKKEMPSKGQIEEACSAVHAVMSEIVAYGLLPTVFVLSTTQGDTYGRRRLTFRADEASEVVLIRPSQYHLAGFPSITAPQIIVTGARLETSGEPLRFRMRHDSEFQFMWSDYPKRAPESPRSSSIVEAG